MRQIRVELPGRPYSVWVGSAGIERVAELTAPPDGAEACALITDANVAALHGDRARAGLDPWGLRIEQLTLEPGEATKAPATAEAAWRWLTDTGVHRGDLVVALGGGVVGDLAGFVAATYHRGVAFLQLPTSLLAQVDASIGGKTGVDLPEGKNLVGAFHQPIGVIADIDALGTLPEEELITGMAEVVKHGLIADPSLLTLVAEQRGGIVARDPEVLGRVVAGAAAVKAAVVAADEREAGGRAHLNYGHTLAHALEALAGYEGLTHGRAVAVGMMFAAELAVTLGYADRREEHRAALDAIGLPTGDARAPYDEVARLWLRDKKYAAGMRFVVLEDLGAPTVVGDVPEAALRRAYEAVR